MKSPHVRFARNPFASKTYVFVSEPSTCAGVLASTRVYSGDLGLLGVEMGVVQGWGNLRDNNSDKSLTGALRWRTADMNTWIDYEFIVGNEQNDDFSDVQAPPSRIVSPTGQLKQLHSLNGWHTFDQHWSMGTELVYGRQDGDGKASTLDIVEGPGFNGAHWWGANAVVTYQVRQDLSWSLRGSISVIRMVLFSFLQPALAMISMRSPPGFVMTSTRTFRCVRRCDMTGLMRANTTGRTGMGAIARN